MYTALMNGDYAAMEDALEVFEDVDRECINGHSKERIVDSFIEEFGAGIPMFVSFCDGLTKLLEFCIVDCNLNMYRDVLLSR